MENQSTPQPSTTQENVSNPQPNFQHDNFGSQPVADGRPMTFGEKLVGITFNPSADDKVAKAKQLCAELADLLNEHNESQEKSQDSQRLFSHAVSEILNAQMNVVKVLTYKY